MTRLKTKGRECDFDKMDLKEAIKLAVTLYTPLPKLQIAIITKNDLILNSTPENRL